MRPEDILEESEEVSAGSSYEVDVAIVGAGVAGMYSTYCCSLANINCVLIDELMIAGGQCMALYPEKLIYGVPGYTNIRAKDYISHLSEQCLGKASHEFFGYRVTKITRTANSNFKVIASNVSVCSNSISNIAITSRYIIIATGIGEMKPNIPANIQGLNEMPKGSDFVQSYCLNHTLYRNKNVIVAGGGDSAVDFAIDIASVAKQITLIHRREVFSCEPHKIAILDKLARNGKIKLELEQNIYKLKEENGIRSVHTKDKNQCEREYETDHIVFCFGFVSCLSTLATDLGLQTEKNLIKVNLENMETSVNGCYAVGDVITYASKKKNIVPCFFEADRAVRAIKNELSGG
ncbi:MAG: NAD(P)/FAD-dependent oxidoreductase [Alphaproteobacteria bacterium]|nr:NAD(P)/FAD-dependent oxidoreductase [Alphaproteobacteria bacterium]